MITVVRRSDGYTIDISMFILWPCTLYIVGVALIFIPAIMSVSLPPDFVLYPCDAGALVQGLPKIIALVFGQ
jgi:hypothetical protein